MIRPALAEDLEPLTDMMMRFTEESDLPLTYDREKIREVAWRTILSDEAILLVHDSEGMLTGMVTGFVDDEFSIEPCAYINKFYIDKEFRGVGVSRALIRAFDEECKKRGIVVSFASSTAGMGERNEKLYVHLFEKCGYTTLGRVMIKGLKDG